MKHFIFLLILAACSHSRDVSDRDVELYCQDLNVLYLKIGLISSNIANVTTTRTVKGGPYLRRVAQNCRQGICEIVEEKTAPLLRYEPKHPDANKNGYVAYPNISLQLEEADRLLWTRVFETVYANSPVDKDFFFKDARAKNCFMKYPNLKAHLDFSEYLGR
jgi:flagellar basal-body rod protein FlgC